MRIGVDIDGVIFDSEKLFRVYSEIYDVDVLKKDSTISNHDLKLQTRYNWTSDEQKNFFSTYYENIIKKSNFMTGAKEVLIKLYNEGHELFIISSRGGFIENEIEITLELLKNNDLSIFKDYYWNCKSKSEVCKKLNIDLMIDDYDMVCKELIDNDINVIYLKDSPSLKIENKKVITLNNWGEIYKFIKLKNLK